MATYKFSEARQNLASILEKAAKEGEVKILRKDGMIFVLKPEKSTKSPLDVKGLSTTVSKEEILDAILDSRRRG